MFTITNVGSLQIHGGGSHESGIIELVNDFLVFLGNLSGHSGGEIFDMLMPGIASMANFHPLFVHFPIALLSMFFLIEVICVSFHKETWQVLSNGLLYSGTVFAALAVYLGFRAAETVPHDDLAHAIMERHESIGVAILILAGFLSVWRWASNKNLNIQLKALFLVFSAILNSLILFGADLGGLMVYGHGVGVKVVAIDSKTIESESESDHDHDHNHDH
jgi:uncharacterized membrane protein